MPHLEPGLVSVTFRQLSPAEVIDLAVKAKIKLLEWGGDVHVPHGSIDQAREVGHRTRESGLVVAAYGSYYRVGDPSQSFPFEQVLETATALEAPLIRVWAGDRASAEANESDRERVLQDFRRICDLAASAGLKIAFEFHGGTLTDSSEAAVHLLNRVNRPDLQSLWQPLGNRKADAYRTEIQTLLPWLANVHVFHWEAGKSRPLAEGEQAWHKCIGKLASASRPIGLLLEFVRDGSPEQFLDDAATLWSWLSMEEESG